MNILGEFELIVLGALLIASTFIGVNIALAFILLYKQLKKNSTDKETKNFLHRLDKKFKEYHLNVRVYLFINIILVAIFLGLMHLMFFPSPRVISTYPNADNSWVEDGRPIVIEFTRPIREGLLETNLNADVQGTWVYEKSFGFLPFVRVVKFYPNETFPAGQKNIIYLVNFDQRDIGEYQYEFFTAALPNVKTLTPLDKEENVSIDNGITIELDNPNGKFVDWDFKLTPVTEFDVNYPDDTHMVIKPKSSLTQTTKYSIEVIRIPQKFSFVENKVITQDPRIKIHESYFNTVKAPLVESYSPKGTAVMTTEDIVIIFDAQMDQDQVEKAFKIEPNVEGVFSWDNDRTLRFNPTKDLVKDTKYKITLAKGLQDINDGVTETEIIIEFETIGKVKVTEINPANGFQNGDVNGSVYVKFNQAVDKASAQSKFAINPNIAGTFRWDGNTMIFKPSAAFAYETSYTITVNPGVKTINGLDSVETYTSTFRTRALAVILNVQRIVQQNSFGCNSTALAMILNYKGAPSSEQGVINGVGNVGTRQSGGNPHLGWVSNYGVYWEPLRNYAISRGFGSSYYRTNWNLTSLLQEVEQGNPVLIWYQNGNSTPSNISYTASNGQNVYAINGMHSIVVVGYDGTPQNPTGVYVVDPYWYPGVTRLTPQFFDWAWSTWRGAQLAPDGNHRRSALVVK